MQELHFAEVKEEECPAPTGPVPSGAGTVEDGGHKRKRSEAERQVGGTLSCAGSAHRQFAGAAVTVVCMRTALAPGLQLVN